MKKLLTAVVLLLSFSVCSFALVNVGVSGGYASVAMTDFNNYLDENSKDLKDAGFNPSLTKMGSGLYVNLDLNFGVMPILNLGIRSGVLYCFQGKMTSDIDLGVIDPSLSSYSGSLSETFDALLIPVMGGLGLNIGLPGMPFSVNAGIYAGYGFSTVSDNANMNITPFNISANPVYTGGGFVMDAGIGLNFPILPFFNASFNVAYRLAKIPEVKASSDVVINESGISTTVVKKDDVLKNQDGDTIPIDYSGINVGVGINFGF
jgi:hypothetical protein